MALAILSVVAGFYLYARFQMRLALKNLPGKIGIDIQQSTEGFSLSKSEGGRTLFTIHASKATQFKQGGRAELHDVNIIVYGSGRLRVSDFPKVGIIISLIACVVYATCAATYWKWLGLYN